jgi:hypothetical protein
MAILGDRTLAVFFVIGGAFMIWSSLKTTSLGYAEPKHIYHQTFKPGNGHLNKNSKLPSNVLNRRSRRK